MLGYTAADVMNKITPADISDPQELIARARRAQRRTRHPITPGFEALVFKASRGIEDIYELTYIRKDGSRFPAVVSVTALRDEQACDHRLSADRHRQHRAEAGGGSLAEGGRPAERDLQQRQLLEHRHRRQGRHPDLQRRRRAHARLHGREVMNKITPADISDPQEVIARAKALSVELGTTITPGFEALVFKASRGIEDIYELTYIRKDGSRFPPVVSVTALRDAQERDHRLPADRHRQHRAQAGRGRAEEARPAPARPAVLHALADRIEHRRAHDDRPVRFITDVNKQMEALTGCTRDELIGAPFKNYFTDPERAEAAIKLVLSEKKVTDYELTARAATARRPWCPTTRPRSTTATARCRACSPPRAT
jgi:PAS domain-containing protein